MYIIRSHETRTLKKTFFASVIEKKNIDCLHIFFVVFRFSAVDTAVDTDGLVQWIRMVREPK